jgi:hypothetical protein
LATPPVGSRIRLTTFISSGIAVATAVMIVASVSAAVANLLGIGGVKG